MPQAPKESFVRGMAEFFASFDRYTPPASARATLQPWVFGLTTRGAVLCDAERNPTFARAGDCILIRALTPQYWRVPTVMEGGAGHWNVIYCAFTPRAHWYPWLQALAPQPLTVFRLSTVRLRRRVARRLFRAKRISRSADAHRNEFAMYWLEGALLDCFHDHLSRVAAPGLDPRVNKAIGILTAQADEPVRLDVLARRCHLSRSQFAQLFRRQVGVTPFVFQERRRIEAAQRMLRMSFEPVSAIAQSCGFEDSRYFATRFKHETGMTPREYRKAQTADGKRRA